MSDVQRLTIQLRAPRGTDAGKVAIGHYCTADNFVTLCDEAGKPIGDKHVLAAGDNPRLIACQLLRRRHNASRSHADWAGRLQYPRMGKI
jgi:hypothetical protein